MANLHEDSLLVKGLKGDLKWWDVNVTTMILKDFEIKHLCQLKCVSKFFLDFIPFYGSTSPFPQFPVQPDKLQLVLASSDLRTLSINFNDEKPSHEIHPLEILADLPLVSNSTQMVGSCKGLVCFYTPPNTYFLLNPTTRESRVLPDPGTFSTRRRHRLSGFVYDLESGNFMVISAAIHHDGIFDSEVKVFSAKTHSWKAIEHPVRALLYVRHPDQSVSVNGVCHWLGRIPSPEPDAFNEDEDYEAVYKILVFDIAKEKFTMFPVHEGDQSTVRDLGLLNGCLCILTREPDLSVGMWVMTEYGIAKSWNKIFSIQRSYISNRFLTMYPICVAGDRILLNINHHLYLYNPKEDKTANLHVELLESKSKKGKPLVARYEETLVSPYGFFSRDGRQITTYIVAEESETRDTLVVQ